jgi:hypothetical protein
MKLHVILPDDVQATYGVDRVIPLDIDALLDLPASQLAAIERAMPDAPSLQKLRYIELPAYSAAAHRAIGYLALRQAGKEPPWASFDPPVRDLLYVVDEGADVDPPAGGNSSPGAPAGSSSPKSGRPSRTSSASRRTSSRSTK